MEFFLDDDLRRPFQSKLGWPLSQTWPLAVLDAGSQEALLLPSGGWMLGEVVGLGLVKDVVDVALGMGGNVGEVVVTDAEDFFVV